MGTIDGARISAKAALRPDVEDMFTVPSHQVRRGYWFLEPSDASSVPPGLGTVLNVARPASELIIMETLC